MTDDWILFGTDVSSLALIDKELSSKRLVFFPVSTKQDPITSSPYFSPTIFTSDIELSVSPFRVLYLFVALSKATYMPKIRTLCFVKSILKSVHFF